mmetsp:Transcript_30471/g.22200  ORF Transcript_30471/g.22200 Transcript_30471/m.22200 type:complete len:118 (+) Transcript_30471:231-584(+)|eukprot:CAMPEP_0116874544 /NCGR_PEP_ID=MMETSP0463-20121206/6015_1 /TAXON_ID=181622 /ORGANISM="Strombidinopsis sp, Strain SopsisLIS2011" /LENGTH=117 /DNA_ID=CAMNT_0004518313 /DNA_START=228 /DNA_END=581 /DNA_ORIENTATION=+
MNTDINTDNYDASKPKKVDPAGFPDTGNGYYSKNLPYDKWLGMANGQRAQMNFLESINFYFVASISVALYYPTWAWIYALIFLIARGVYGYSYGFFGAPARLPAAIVLDIAMLAAFI